MLTTLHQYWVMSRLRWILLMGFGLLCILGGTVAFPMLMTLSPQSPNAIMGLVLPWLVFFVGLGLMGWGLWQADIM
jgi:hypothetical protein